MRSTRLLTPRRRGSLAQARAIACLLAIATVLGACAKSREPAAILPHPDPETAEPETPQQVIPVPYVHVTPPPASQK